MKKFWFNILLYGFSLGLLIAALQVFRYKWVFVSDNVDWYVGLVALLFTVLGIWAGITLTRRKKTMNVPASIPTVQNTGLAAAGHGITPREMEVLHLMSQGHSNQEIADQLFVSLNTVKTHISNLLSKLDAQRRTQAIQKAKALGLLP